jgi:hypothetical protein
MMRAHGVRQKTSPVSSRVRKKYGIVSLSGRFSKSGVCFSTEKLMTDRKRDMIFNQNFAPETRDYLCGFARRRLSDSELAEDVVQETLLSAFRAGHSLE